MFLATPGCYYIDWIICFKFAIGKQNIQLGLLFGHIIWIFGLDLIIQN